MVRKLCAGIALFELFFGYPFMCLASLVITSPSPLPNAVKGESYKYQLEAEGFIPGTLNWSIEPTEMEYIEIETPHHFAGIINASRIMDSEHHRPHDAVLPFTLCYYGDRYRKIRIGRAGNFGFLGVAPYSISMLDFKRSVVMAPLLSDFYMNPSSDPYEGDGVYFDARPWRCVFTWRGRSSSTAEQDRNF